MNPPAHDSQPPDAPQGLLGELHDRGLRMTPQRRLVVDAVASLGHATPEEVLTKVREVSPGVNLSTVYRNLELLGELGLLRHSHLGHGPTTWHVPSHSGHIHLLCRACGRVTEADVALADDLVGRLRERTGFLSDMEHFAVQGTCADCAASAEQR
ncbi:MAG TPA: Fur family transcriptional regulator [Actinomycetes bacterium]|nr:Fur family transcriptional regulator [Actinomycetes bacterium]